MALSEFEQAFADARKAYLQGKGPATFSLNGKTYTVRVDGERELPKAAARPTRSGPVPRNYPEGAIPMAPVQIDVPEPAPAPMVPTPPAQKAAPAPAPVTEDDFYPPLPKAKNPMRMEGTTLAKAKAASETAQRNMSPALVDDDSWDKAWAAQDKYFEASDQAGFEGDYWPALYNDEDGALPVGR